MCRLKRKINKENIRDEKEKEGTNKHKIAGLRS